MNKKQLYLLLGLSINTPAAAQQPPAVSAEEIVVTASRFEQRAGDQPVGVQVITAQEIRNSGETSLPRVLARQPGVFVRDNSGSPDMQVDLRGFGVTGDQNTLVLVDGRRLSEYELTAARWSSIPLDSIERIEIVRGSGAVLYGGGSTGGVINILTKGAQPAGKSFAASAAVGSYNAWDYRAGGHIAGETIGLALHGGHLRSDNYRDNNRVEQNNLVADLRNFDPDRALNLKLGYEQQDLRLPGNRTEAELETDRRGTRTPSDFANRRSGFANLSGQFNFGDTQLVTDVGYREKHDEFHAAFAGLTLDGDTRVATWRFSPRLKVPYAVRGVANSLVLGFDWEDWDYESVRSNPATATARQRNTAIYAQNVATPAAGTALSIGGRLQGVEFQAADASAAAGSAAGEQNRNVSAYEIGARHELSPASAVYARYGYSFRIATLDEVYAPGLGAFFIPATVNFIEPQTSHDSELGLETQAGTGTYRIAVFRSELKNEIHFDSGAFANVNLPPTKRSGVEVEGKWALAADTVVYANYTYTEARFRSAELSGVDVSGNRIPLVPRHMVNAGIDWRVTQRTQLNAVAHYVGSQLYDGDEANTFGRKMPSYWTVDMGVYHTVADWTFGASVRNLFDEHYYTYALAITFPTSTFVAYPAPERNYLASVEYRFR